MFFLGFRGIRIQTQLASMSVFKELRKLSPREAASRIQRSPELPVPVLISCGQARESPLDRRYLAKCRNYLRSTMDTERWDKNYMSASKTRDNFMLSARSLLGGVMENN